MTLVQTIILGTLQGLTEFLPISSSGHLILAEKGFNNFHRPGLCLEVLLHMGTFISILVYFREDLKNILMDIMAKANGSDYHGRRWALMISLGAVPTALIGFLFKDWFERIFPNAKAVGFSLIVTGILLWISDRVKDRKKNITNMNIYDSIVIGLVQGMALMPGISRSGSTITTGIFLGLDRDTAARFSFLLSIPVYIGVFLFELKELYMTSAFNMGNYLLGALIACIAGYLSIVLLFKMVICKRLSPFAYYCWTIAFIALFLV